MTVIKKKTMARKVQIFPGQGNDENVIIQKCILVRFNKYSFYTYMELYSLLHKDAQLFVMVIAS